MLLPQSSAFVSLRNRLNAVSGLGFLHIPKPFVLPPFSFPLEMVNGMTDEGLGFGDRTYTQSVAATRSKIGARDEIKWEELLRREFRFGRYIKQIRGGGN